MSTRPLLGEYVEPDDSNELRRRIERLTGEKSRLQVELLEAKERLKAMESGVRSIQRMIEPWKNAIGLLFGEIENMNMEDEHSKTSVPSRISAVWDQWKRKLPGKPAEVIQCLLDHGTLSRQQLRAAAGGGWSTIDAATGKLASLGLIDRAAGKYCLRQL